MHFCIKGESATCLLKYSAISFSAMLALGAGTRVMAQSQDKAWVEMETTSVMVGVGGHSGDGILWLPNLGSNCSYPFKVEGFGAGIQVSISKVTASGLVKNLTNVTDFAGKYTATQGEATLLAGGGGMSMKNDHNNVVMDLASRTRGIGIGVGAQGLTIKFDKPIADGPHTHVVEFGFNKTWVSEDAAARLAPLVSAWKCRYVDIELVGHTDMVGKEDANLELSDNRAKSVRDYLIGAGIVPTRITTRAAGKNEPLVPTGAGVRERSNRAVVVTVK
jgi:outer membrane protein OmpA-like peptidoglycan-associated protein